MIKFRKQYIMTAAAIATIGLASCSNELNEADLGNSGGNLTQIGEVSLVKTPDVVAWSGKQTLGNSTKAIQTRGGQNANGNMWSNTYDVPGAISQEEKDKVVAEFSKVRENWVNKTVVTWDNFFIQQVYKGETHYKDGYNQDFLGSDKMNELYVYCPLDWNSWNGGYDHAGGFNGGKGDQNNGIALYEHMSDIIAKAGKQFAYSNSQDGGKMYFDYIILLIDGEYYVGFDFWANGQNPNEKVKRDWVFNDWIVKILPGENTNTSIEPNDPRYLGPGDDVADDEDDPTLPDDGNDENDGDDTVIAIEHNQEVEVNYAILDSHSDYKIADLVTKLSIHVRYATDVDIKIPVPIHYLIESDDLYIFKEHFVEGDGNGIYGGYTNTDFENFLENKNTSVSYNIDGNVVTLYVDFEPADITLGESFKFGYIHVYTRGINQNVIDACWEYNKDGINFEVYNYFQTEKVVWNEGDEFASVEEANDLNRKDLYKAMNESLIEFTYEPPYYINAFGYDYNNGNVTEDQHQWHATVVPMEKEGYKDPYTTTHLNSTPYNDIYVHSDVKMVDDLHSER